MIVKTKGIVLGNIKFGDSSIITRIYCQELGLKPFLMNGVRKVKSRQGMAYFQLFSILELTAYYKDSREVQRLSSCAIASPLQEVYQNIDKITVLFFLGEVLLDLLRSEELSNYELFDFLESSILALENQTGRVECFHLQFLIKLAPYLGYSFSDNQTTMFSPQHKIEERDLQQISALKEDVYGACDHIERNIRTRILDYLMDFYSFHSHLGKIKSRIVLEKLFS